jgi:D-alanyl-D-alanine carboxypeptidase
MSWGRWLVVVVLVLATGCTTPAPAPVADPLAEYLDGLVARKEFRGAVEVRRGDEVLLSRGYDRAGPNRSNGTRTRFRIASITKQFTGFAILLLRDDGKLAVTDSVCAHLPDCPAAWRPITIEHLVTHTAGLVNYSAVDDVAAERFFARIGTREPTPDQLIAEFADEPPQFPPGSKWEYGNSAYVLLGRIVELSSGQSYGEFLRHRILDPLGMADTGYRPAAPTGDRYATTYADWENPVGYEPTPAVFFASGGMYSTVADLVRWQRFLLTGSPDLGPVADLLAPRVPTNAVEQYGYGIESRGDGAARTYSHSGLLPGVATYLEIRPRDRLSVVVLSNLDHVDAKGIGRNLMALAK